MPSVPEGPNARFLTPGEVAKVLHVHPRTVARWADAGRIRSVSTVGGHRRFSLGEVLRLRSGDTVDAGSSTHQESTAADAAVVVAGAAVRAREVRLLAAREADVLVAHEAARNVVATRQRVVAAAARVSEAARLAAESTLALATPGDEEAASRASRTAATVQAAAVLVAADAERLADAVSADVATTAELVSERRLAQEHAIEAVVVATSTALAAGTPPVDRPT